MMLDVIGDFRRLDMTFGQNKRRRAARSSVGFARGDANVEARTIDAIRTLYV